MFRQRLLCGSRSLQAGDSGTRSNSAARRVQDAITAVAYPYNALRIRKALGFALPYRMKSTRTQLKKVSAPAPGPGQKDPEAQPWTRGEADRALIIELGVRLKAVREQRSLSLTQLSGLSGVPAATLSRIENSKMSPTAGILARVMVALDIDWNDLVGPKRIKPGERLLSYSDAHLEEPSDIRGFTAHVLHPYESATMQPLIFDVQIRNLSEVGLFGHAGEEFCYVLAGTLVFHAEGKPPKVMPTGTSILFDSRIPHAYVAGDAGGAKILLVVTRRYGSHLPNADSLK